MFEKSDKFNLGIFIYLCWWIVAFIMLFLVWKDTPWLSNKIVGIFYLSWYAVIFIAGHLVEKNKK